MASHSARRGSGPTKRFLGWPQDARFLVPDGVYEHFAGGRRGPGGARPVKAWEGTLEEYRAANRKLADELGRIQRRELPDGWDEDIPTFPRGSRRASPAGTHRGRSKTPWLKRVPWLVGGAADLASLHEDATDVRRRGGLRGRAIEPGATSTSGSASTSTAAIATAWRCSKLRPYWSGFLIFSDFARGVDQAVGADGDPLNSYLHARLDRRRRGRPDPPAGRAARLAAGDPRPARVPPRRRQQGGGDVAVRDAAGADAAGLR